MARITKVIKDTTTLALPQEKWEELKALCANYGQKQNIAVKAGISATTLDRVLEYGNAQKRTLTKIMDYMKAAKQEEEQFFKDN